MCIKEDRSSCTASHSGCHCWHPLHEGPWYGVIPPDSRCCHCGLLLSQLHGPFKPQPYGNTYWYGTGNNIKVTFSVQPVTNSGKIEIR
jgi:hypothetical protein